MRQADIKNATLLTLLTKEDLVPSLWARVGEVVGKIIPLSTYYRALYSLRSDGLVHYQSRQLTDKMLMDLIDSLSSDGMEAQQDEDIGVVRLTNRGKAHAELLFLQELIPASQQRKAMRHIQCLQKFFSEVGAGVDARRKLSFYDARAKKSGLKKLVDPVEI